MASYIPATLSLDPAEAARIHAERLSLALAAKATRDAALAARKGSSSSSSSAAEEEEKEEDAAAAGAEIEMDAAKMEEMRRALGACANRERLFTTPDYAIDVAFSAAAFPDDEEWVARGGLGPQDKVLDLGCGAGPALIKAARRGAQAVGYEINEKRAEEARRNVAALPDPEVRARIEVIALNAVEVIDTCLADGVTYVFMYLTPRGIRKLLKYFRQNPRRLRVVSYINPMHEGGYLRPGAKVPGRKVWCASPNPNEQKLGVKFPLYCYEFGGVAEAAEAAEAAKAAEAAEAEAAQRQQRLTKLN
jgi:SAM-dependent methyltransferase